MDWTLYTSALPTASGAGAIATAAPTAANTNVNQGSVTNSTYTNFSNGYFAFQAVHSTSTNAITGAEFDQLYFDTSSSSPMTKSVPAPTVAALPMDYHLMQNYPNPFNPTTNIRFSLASPSEVRLAFYDVLGQEVKVLVNEQRPAGIHEVLFDGTNLASGMYYYRLTALPLDGTSSAFIETKRLMLVK